MLEWIANNHQVLNVLLNLGMLVVWLVYLQLFLGRYRQQRRPKILINRGAGSGLGARCLIGNMSAEAIYIESIIATLETPEGRSTCPITELKDHEEKEVLSGRKLATRQGPLLTGHVTDIGTFHSVVDHVLQQGADRRTGVDVFIRSKLLAVEITVAAVHGSEDLLAGAKRRFDIVRQDEELYLKVHSVDTEQIRSRRARKKITDTLKADL